MRKSVLGGMCFAALGAQAASAALFQGLGFLPDTGSSTTSAISDDGTVIVGTSGSQGFVWTAGTGKIGIAGILEFDIAPLAQGSRLGVTA